MYVFYSNINPDYFPQEAIKHVKPIEVGKMFFICSEIAVVSQNILRKFSTTLFEDDFGKF